MIGWIFYLVALRLGSERQRVRQALRLTSFVPGTTIYRALNLGDSTAISVRQTQLSKTMRFVKAGVNSDSHS